MIKLLEIDFNDIDKLLFYDETSPSCLRWKASTNYKIRVGDIAGYIVNNKQTGRRCWAVSVQGNSYLAHRLGYCLLHGSVDPELQVDHIDGNALNNKADNLRLVKQAVNLRNRPQQRNNITGVTGVSYDVRNDRYIAQFNDLSGKRKQKKLQLY